MLFRSHVKPTNHLDLEMRLALTMALQDFEGALVVVSHDRHLLRTVADDLWLVSDGQAKPFDGDLDDYRQWLLIKDKTAKDNSTKTESPTAMANTKKDDRRIAAEARQRLEPLRNKVKKAEKEMTSLQQVINDVEEKLADNSMYEACNKDDLKQLLLEQAAAKSQLELVETAWLEASEAIESATQQA